MTPYFLTTAIASAQALPVSSPSPVIVSSSIMGLGFAIISGLIVVLGYFLRKQLEAILDAQRENRDRQIDCRETLPIRFADKAETHTALSNLYSRTDRHENALTRHEAILYARGMAPSERGTEDGL